MVCTPPAVAAVVDDEFDNIWPPDRQAPGYGAGANSITAAAWADLPSYAPTASLANPHATASLLVQVMYAAWMVGTSATCYAGLASNGGDVAITPAPGEPGAAGWSQNLEIAASTPGCQCSGWFTVEIPASSTLALKFQAYRVSGTTCGVNYPVLEIIPLRYV